jgi:pilus assembly protein Flp/PilA
LEIHRNLTEKGKGSCVMSKVLNLVQKLRRDEDGAALIEYTVLLGIMLVAVIGTIVLVGGWIGTQWTNLQAALP